MNKSKFTREAVNFHLKVLKGFPRWSWNVWNILEKIPDGGGSLCCDNPKVEARVSHLLRKYLIASFSSSEPFAGGGSAGFSGEDEEHRGTCQVARFPRIQQEVLLFVWCCLCCAATKHQDK